MDLKKEYRQILNDYPKYVSKDMMCRICHISKRKALYLLEKGLVPCSDSGKQTRKYTIATKDIVDYLVRRDLEPERYLLHEDDTSIALSSNINEKMLAYYESQLEKYPDVMNVKQIAEFTGYVETTVVGWCNAKKLHSFCIRRTYKIPKQSLLEFMMSIEFRDIRVKSKKHKEIIEALTYC